MAIISSEIYRNTYYTVLCISDTMHIDALVTTHNSYNNMIIIYDYAYDL